MSDELINIKKYRAKGISKSESDITTAEKQRWDSGFPPGVTVDELCWFRKKRPQGGCLGQRDHLNLGEGSFQSVKSEYKRRYRNHFLMSGSQPNLIQEQEITESSKFRRPPDSLRCEGQRELKPLYAESFREHPLEQVVKRRPRNSFWEVMEACKDSDDGDRFSSEIRSKYVRYSDAVEKQEVLRRPTNLKIEGELLAKTEQAEKFIEYLLTKREQLLRKPTTLKLEGEMEKKTETGEKFAPVEYQKRPPLCKKSTNLHLEGDFDILTENLEKYVPLEYQPRPALTKASTNLHLEGELDLQPEYRDVYVEYKSERPRPSLPSHNLKLDGFFETQAVSPTAHPPIPFLRGTNSGRKIVLGDDLTSKYHPEYREKFVEHSRPERSQIRRPQPHLQQKGDMQTVTENKSQFVEKRSPRAERRRLQNNLKLEGGLELTPEYRKSYVNYYDEESRLKRRGALMRGTTLRNEGDMEINPEYRSSYVNFPRERPSVKKPECHLINEGKMDHLTEKHAKYVQHSNYPRPETLRREPELKLEGNFECQPEYRKAYIDYLIRERVERKPRPLDNLGVQTKRAFEVVQAKGEPPANTENVKVVVEQIPKAKTSAQPPRTSQIPVRKQPEAPSKKSSSQLASTTLPKTGLLRVKAETSGSSSSKQSSRSVSPIPSGRRSRSDGPSSRRRPSGFKNGKEEVIHHSRVGSRFSSPVKVEDLAYRPCTSPLSVLLQQQPRKSRGGVKTDEKKSRAFLLIDDEINNNNFAYEGKRNSHDGLFKEQRWMSPWYIPPPP